MPRNGSGVYTLPAGNPVVDGTIIDTGWANPTMEDIAYQLNNVLTRDGLLTPTAAFKVVDGSTANPGLAFQTAGTTGLYKTATAAGFSYSGVSYWSAGASGMNVMGMQLAAGVPSGSGTIGQLLVGGSSINPLAILDVQSTTKAFKLPVMTTAQKNAIGNSAGLVVFDSTIGQISSNNGSVWAEAGGGGGGGTAADITNVPYGSISATNVQAAINELDTEKLPYVVPGTSGNFLRSNGSAWISSPFTYNFDGNVPGNLTFQTSGSVITGNFSDTVNSGNRIFFQSSAAGNPSYVSARPSSTGYGSGFVAHENYGVTQSAFGFMGVTSTGGAAVAVTADRTGSAAYLPLVFSAGGARAMTIQTNGDAIYGGNAIVGNRVFQVKNTDTAATSGAVMALVSGSKSSFIQQAGNGDLYYENINAGASSSHSFKVDGGKRVLYLNNNGATFGDSTVAPTTAMYLYSTAGSRIQYCSAQNIGYTLSNSTAWAMYSAPTTGNLIVTGTVSQGSDETLKTDWGPLMPNFVDLLSEVQSGSYTRIDTGARQVGVSAQALQTIIPEAVETVDGGTLAVAYGSAALVACVELAKEVKLLRARIEQLEGML